MSERTHSLAILLMVSEWRPSPEDSIRAVGRKEGWSSLWHPAPVRGNGAIRRTATKLRLRGWFVGVECGGSKRNISASSAARARVAHRTDPDVRITASSSSRASVPRATWPLRGWQRVLHEPALKRGHGRLDPGVLLPRIQMICSSVNRSRFSRPSPLR